MIRLVTTLLLFNCFHVASEASHPINKTGTDCTQIYLCSRLTEPAKKWNDVISQGLANEFYIFRPQDIDLEGLSGGNLDVAIYNGDFEGMTNSDALLVLPPYGRDCAWEIGWFCGKERPAIAYVENEGDWLGDPMVKGGLTAIITNNSTVYEILSRDSSTKDKSYLIPSRKDLAQAIRGIVNERKQETQKQKTQELLILAEKPNNSFDNI